MCTLTQLTRFSMLAGRKPCAKRRDCPVGYRALPGFSRAWSETTQSHHFEHGLHCTKRLSGRYETILWFTKSDDYVFNLDPIRVPSKYPQKKYFKGPKVGQLSGTPLGKNPSDVWIFPNVKNNHVEKTIHPCQFPVELVERLVLSLTDAGDTVFDPYMGVGSSVVAALMCDRRGYGCDVVQDYVDIAWDRVHALRAGELKTRPMNKPVYDPTKPYGGHR